MANARKSKTKEKKRKESPDISTWMLYNRTKKKRNKLSACVKKKEFVAVMYQRIRDDFLYIYTKSNDKNKWKLITKVLHFLH